jgi:hypothetical protein
MFLVFTQSKYGIRKTKWKRCVRKRVGGKGGMLNYSTRDAMTTKEEEDLCVDSRDWNRTCLHVDFVRDCRKRRCRRRQTDRRRKRQREKKTFNSNCRSRQQGR